MPSKRDDYAIQIAAAMITGMDRHTLHKAVNEHRNYHIGRTAYQIVDSILLHGQDSELEKDLPTHKPIEQTVQAVPAAESIDSQTLEDTASDSAESLSEDMGI